MDENENQVMNTADAVEEISSDNVGVTEGTPEIAEASEIVETPEEKAAKKKAKIKQEIKEWVIDIGVAVIIALLILQFVMPTIVQQHSMENTLHESDYVFVSKKAYTWFGEPEYGDIIVFQSSLEDGRGNNKLLVKRIIGVPGDTISISGGYVYRNGEKLEEPYTKDGVTNGDYPEATVPEGHIFCMGDNRQNSSDSRDSRIGMVDLKLVKGKVVLRLLPLQDFGGVYKNFNK